MTLPRSLLRSLIALSCATTMRAQPEPSEILLRVRDNVLNSVDRLPRYLCTQTVDRRQYEPNGITGSANCESLERMRGTRFAMVLTTADRLRLDVGVAQGQEAYSWAGENRFGDQSLFEIVREGSISTGYFHGFLALVFRTDNALFSYLGDKTQDGRKLVEYSFEVPLEQSHYIFRANGNAYTTAYEGTLTVEPETAELVSLTVRTRDLAAASGACEVVTSMDYTRWRVNDTNFLLPARTRMDIRDLNGVESKNETVYTGCREFVGESTLRFETPGDRQVTGSPMKSSAATGAPPIPAGLPFTIQLAQDIPVATAAAGDPIKAMLTTDLRGGRKILAAKGTPVTCRIQRIRRYYHARSSIVVGGLESAARLEVLLRLETVGSGGEPLAILARPALPAPQPRRPGALVQRGVSLGPLAALVGPNLWFVPFENAGDDYVIPSGLTSDWVTATR